MNAPFIDRPFGPPIAPMVLGIDPGITGGLAWLYPDGTVTTCDIPVAGGEVDVDSVARMIQGATPTFAMIERAAAMPKQGVSSTFKFGAAYGALRAAVAVCQIPQHLVAPTVWKRHFKLSSDKEEARALAIRLWPGSGQFARKKDHGRAEAALIARYGAETLAGRGAP